MKKDIVVASIILPLAILACNILAYFFSFTELWPGFFVVLLYLIGRCTSYSEMKEIIGGGVIGIFWSWWVMALIAYLIPIIGMPFAAWSVFVGSVFILVILGHISTTLFNNYSAIYFFTASILPQQRPVEWIISLVVVGAVFSFFVFGGITYFMRPKKERAEKAPLQDLEY